nr:hypothetical protein [Tanacetum cinerariifolium]
MMVNQDMDAAPQDVKNLKPLGDDETHTPSISPADKIVNNENNVDKSISETMPVASDKFMETETTIHELQDQGDPLSKLTHDGANLLDKPEVSSSKLEDEKESKIEDKTELVEMSTSSPLEQVDNPLESSTKTDDKDQHQVDNNDIPETESQKTSTDSEIVKDDDNQLGDDETHTPSISSADKIVNNENNVDKSISETMPVASDKVMETETTNHELQDQEDEKESKIEDKTELVEMSTSSPLEQVDNPLESSTKTDDKDQDLVDNNDIPETESQRTSTDSEIVLDDDNVNGNDSHDDNVNGNDSHLFNSSVNIARHHIWG